MEQQRISYKECQEIVTLLERIQKGIFPEESRRQEANAKRTGAFLIILAILSFVFLAFFFLSM